MRLPVLLVTTAGALCALVSWSGPTAPACDEACWEQDNRTAAAETVAGEIARVSEGRACVDPAGLPAGVFPSWVAVSDVTGTGPQSLVSTSVRLVPLGAAWTGAKAGVMAVRCVIV